VPGDLGTHQVIVIEHVEETRALVARACRILASHGLIEGILGHVSARAGDDAMLIRCRGPLDRGVLFTEPADVRLVSLDGEHLEDSPGFEPPNELPIHGELLRARPEANSVVHAHPWSTLVTGVAGLELRPVFGAFDIPAMRMASEGVPVFGRSCLITRKDLAAEMIDAMDGRDACVLRGHGITVTGRSVPAAAVRALDLDTLARVTVRLAQAGAPAPEAISDEDMAELPDLGPGFNEERVWRHLVALDERGGPRA
jgi:ribulose-5-phosphate 4-epimerase/fuculose-1-phosphate aldolase